ncbi:MAG: hypothetical protein NC402_01770 [Prevotella sp.]|nr:hypothetical protein [Prevotella sp.]MCM1075380.1 hypothetical protein [Ruminococcus sp.]
MTTPLYIKICEYLRDKIQGTQWDGHIYTVGGCCRDMVLGNEIKDVDLAVDLPDGGVEFAKWLNKQRLTVFKPVLFERYGTAMLKLRAFPNDDIEIVQTRAEKYTDRNSRNPETAFGSIEDDCFRRDLTINALYYNITEGKLLDITGKSLHDLKNHVIATPMDPDSTYDDDPIRILRTIRFACRLGWEVSDDIFQAMCRNSSRLNIIKVERLRGEFEKILLGRNVGRALEMLRGCGTLKFIVPSVVSTFNKTFIPQCDDTLWQWTARAMDLLPPDLTLRWAALLCKSVNWVDNPKKAKYTILQTLASLKYHQPLLKDVLFYSANHDVTSRFAAYAESMPDAALRRLQYLCGKPEKLDALLTLIDAFNKTLPDTFAMPEQVHLIRMREEAMKGEGTLMYEYHLPFAERRIKKLLHIEPGPLVEDTLEYMMQLAFENPKRTRNEFEVLVSKYSPTEPSGDTFLLNDELRPSAKQPKQSQGEKKRHSAHRNHKKNSKSANSNRLTDSKAVSKPRRRHHHRRRKQTSAEK